MLLAYLMRCSEKENAEGAGGWFVCHHRRIERNTNLPLHKQKQLMRLLEGAGLIETKREGRSNAFAVNDPQRLVPSRLF